jgi:hypothetical protein
LKRFIQKMLAEIGPDAFWGSPCGQYARQDEIGMKQGSGGKPSFYRIRSG